MSNLKILTNQKAIAGVLTLSILALLLIAGPVSAFLVNITGFSISNPIQGEKISTNATITINSNERINLNNITLYLDNLPACTFQVNDLETNCPGINIKLVSGLNLGYGYGYGYGYSYGYRNGYTGTFLYNITLDTTNSTIGNHTIQLKLSADNNPTQSNIVTITVQSPQSTETQTTYGGGSYCSTQYTCSQWTACINNTQTRTCNYNTNFCTPSSQKPLELNPANLQ
jgi:hypothetical protein